jgi:ABC-type dipeptide/oligopeptide/nickel transport system ATPase subunit
MTKRTFEAKPAVRTRVPLMVGLMGPSGGGKTYSALRLAAGFQRVTGGETYVIDTEARRALHYADKFKFQHVEFGAPFSPLDYLEAIEYCVSKGATTVIVDSMSHEHEGPGGVLEMHEEALQKLGGNDRDSFRAWAKPKADRRRMINTILQKPCNFIFCFRAKEKTKPGEENGKKTLINIGFMPIAGEEFVYEMGTCALLLPGANGVPTWTSDFRGEKMMIKMPEQFRQLLGDKQLSEDIGEQLARWAAGGADGQPAASSQPRPAAPQFAKTWRKDWASKPLDSAPADVLTAYIADMQAVLDNPAKSAAHPATQKILDGAQAVYEQLLAEEALGSEAAQ